MKHVCTVLLALGVALASAGCKVVPPVVQSAEPASPLTLTQTSSNLLLKIYWPSRYQTAAIPSEANSITIEVADASQKVIELKTVARQAGSESVTVSFRLEAGTAFSIQAKAFRELAPTSSSTPIAIASASNLRLEPSKSIKLPLSLEPSFTLKVKLGDLPANTWSPFSPLCVPRAGLVTGVVNGQIVAFSGDSGITLELFDPESLTWRYRPFSGYFGLTHSAGTAFDGKIYAAGGFNGMNGFGSLISFDPARGLEGVTTLHELPRADAAVVPLNGLIYLIGGYYITSDTGFVLSGVEVYDPESKTLRKAAWLPEAHDGFIADARAGHGAAALGGQIYIAGGYDYLNQPLNTMRRYDPVTNEWSDQTVGGASLPSLNTKRFGFGLVEANGKLYAIGGQGEDGKPLASVEQYDPATNQWTFKSPLPTARSYLACLTVQNRIWAIGGYDGSGLPLRTVETYQP